MAKLAKVTYGTQGDTAEYTYVVRDTVRTGQYLNVAVKHAVSGKIFGTTAITQHLIGENTPTGVREKQAIESKTGNSLTRAYTGSEVGIQSKRGFNMGLQRPEKESPDSNFRNTNDSQTRENFVATEYQKRVREANVERRKSQFDEYSSKFER